VTINRLRRSKKWLSLWLLIAMIGHFAFGLREASAFVLCFGADGHVAVERAGHDHALETGKSGQGGTGRTLAQASADAQLQSTGSPCLDIPVVDEDHGDHKPFGPSQDRLADVGLVALVAFVIALISIDPLPAKLRAVSDPPALDSRLTALRTVVLLI
jgi:hypothetical protein